VSHPGCRRFKLRSGPPEPHHHADPPLASARQPAAAGPASRVDYDFHRGDAYSHYGVDPFLLVREQGRWRIACITYSVVPGGDASPFGGV